MRNIKYIFVHCTAGPQTQTVEQIQKYWKTVNKWKSPGYHYIIKPNGEIVQLLDESKSSNGVAGYNSVSINVCYIGGVDKQGRAVDNRTEYQKESLIYILRELKKKYPNAKIMGHRDIWGSDPKNWKKMCPCFDAKTEYANIGHEEKETKSVEQPVENKVEGNNSAPINKQTEGPKVETKDLGSVPKVEERTPTVGKIRISLASRLFDAFLTFLQTVVDVTSFFNKKFKKS